MNKFDDVENIALRAYNRAIVTNNLFRDAGRAWAEDYLAQFPIKEQGDIKNIISLVGIYGKKEIISAMTKDMEFVDE